MQEEARGTEMTIRGVLRFQKAFTPLVTALSVVVGGVFATIQYMEAKKANRVKEVLAFVERHNNEPIFQSRTKLDDIWTKNFYVVKAVIDPALNPAMSTDAINRAWRDKTLEVIESNALQHDILVLENFYKSIAICVDKGVCDRDTAQSFFGDEVDRFYSLHFPLFKKIREEANNSNLFMEIADFNR